ncbi:very short patch repair endonuclease, partial [Pseudomonas sp. LP_4_YM]|uniref:very short patch repair endonuclease n=1 Tax=Pseudomonas sp. LP_4_YM TaxID=2485135 RepID=UPI00273F89B3
SRCYRNERSRVSEMSGHDQPKRPVTVLRNPQMARIKGSNTRPEIALRKILHGLGLRYRLNGTGLPGKPDLVFPRYKSVVFVHGCFWHRHSNCSIATTPKSNTAFWVEKFEKNVARDIRMTSVLEASGWKVFIVWECEVNSTKKANITGKRLADLIRKK